MCHQGPVHLNKTLTMGVMWSEERRILNALKHSQRIDSWLHQRVAAASQSAPALTTQKKKKKENTCDVGSFWSTQSDKHNTLMIRSPV